MSSLSTVIALLLLVFTLTGHATPPPPAPAQTQGPATVDWTDLMPEEDLKLLMSMPQVDHENMTDEELVNELGSGGLGSMPPATSSLEPQSSLEDEVANAIGLAMQKSTPDRSWRDALVSTRVRPEFDKRRIRIAGYIVPIDYDDNQVISNFFLVPYFGACIHVPPPPPNQIIFVRYPKGLTLDNLYTPFWISGQMNIETVENEMALAAYTMDAEYLEEYKEDEQLD